MRWKNAFASLLVCLVFVPFARAENKSEEAWHLLFVEGQRAGYVHYTSDKIENNGRIDTRNKQEVVLTIKRFNESTKMSMSEETRDKPDGTLYASEFVLHSSGTEVKTTGEARDGKFHVTLKTPGKVVEQVIDWSDKIYSTAGGEKLIADKKLKPGETFQFKFYIPSDSKIATNTVKAIDREDVPMLDGSKKQLLRIDESNEASPSGTSTWVDEQGVRFVTKMDVPGIGTMLFYRSTKEKALEGIPADQVDVGVQSLIIPDKPIRSIRTKQSVTYKFEMADKDSVNLIPSDWYQEKLSTDGNVITVKIRQVVPTAQEDTINPKIPEEFTQANGFIQSDNAKIIAATKEGIGDAKTPWEKAKNLERYVHNKIKKKDYSVGFATAAEVIETCEGDCTEHSVLLTACCRAAGIPARGAMGLVYVEQQNFFGYHMWTEVNIGGKWYPIDAVFGLGHATAGHIKIADGSLKGVSVSDTLLPTVKVMGKLKKIYVQSVE